MDFDYRNNDPRLPDDVLNEMFKLALPSISVESPTSFELNRHQAPMSLTQTCRKWRELAMDSALLWNRIHFKIEPGSPTKIYPRIELVVQMFRLSKNAPLYIYAVSKRDYLRDPLLLRIYSLLFSSLRRWKHVNLYLFGIDFDRLAMEYNNNNTGGIGQVAATELRSLCLRTEVFPDPRTPSSKSPRIYLPTQLWANAPHLQHLELDFTAICPSPGWKAGLHSANTPLNQLTFLEIRGNNYETVLDIKDLYMILQRCALNLVTGRFLEIKTSPWANDENGATMPPIYMPKLQNLLLSDSVRSSSSGRRTEPLTRILSDFVRAPQLASLTLYYDSFIKPALLRVFLQNSQCADALRELDLYESTAQGSFVELLQCLPSLRVLRRGVREPVIPSLENGPTIDITKAFFDAMNVWDEQTSRFVLCPVLEEITLDYWSGIAFHGENYLANLIKRRLNYDGSLNFKGWELCFNIVRLTSVAKRGYLPLHRGVEEIERLCCLPSIDVSFYLTSFSTNTNGRHLRHRKGLFTEDWDEWVDDEANNKNRSRFPTRSMNKYEISVLGTRRSTVARRRARDMFGYF